MNRTASIMTEKFDHDVHGVALVKEMRRDYFIDLLVLKSLMPRSQISGASTIFRGKPTAGSWRPAKCHRTAIPNIWAQSKNCWHRTAEFEIQKKKKKNAVARCLQGSREVKTG